jgi:hypothetical protein
MTALSMQCACGGTVDADTLDPTPGVQAHNATEQHRSWSLMRDTSPVLPKLTVGPLTVDRLRELGLAPKATPRGLRR